MPARGGGLAPKPVLRIGLACCTAALNCIGHWINKWLGVGAVAVDALRPLKIVPGVPNAIGGRCGGPSPISSGTWWPIPVRPGAPADLPAIHARIDSRDSPAERVPDALCVIVHSLGTCSFAALSAVWVLGGARWRTVVSDPERPTRACNRSRKSSSALLSRCRPQSGTLASTIAEVYP